MSEGPASIAVTLSVTAPVVEVTLLEDRARVVRLGSARLDAGQLKVRVEGVAPVLSDRTLSIRADASDVRVVSARVHRRVFTEAADDSDAATLRDELRRDETEITRIRSEVAVVSSEKEGFETLAGLLMDEIAEDVTWGRREAASWEQRLDDLGGRYRDALQKMAELNAELREKVGARDNLTQRIRALENPGRDEWAALEAELLIETEGEYTLRFEYVVPGACWRPYHTARLGEGDSARVEFSTEGCVWQNTGEDWEDVALWFSTQRPSLGTTPPPLTSDVLSVRDKPEGVVVEARDEEVTTTGLGKDEGVAADQLPGIDDGGDTVNLKAEKPATIPSDGRPYRVPLLRFESGAELGVVALPELVEAALLETRQVNTAAAPILAGPVELVRGGGFAGRTHVLFVASGERFALGWGPDPELRVQRDTELTCDKRKALSSWETLRYRTIVRLSNLADRTRTLKVTERIPVSELDKVDILFDQKETTPGAAPDAEGHVQWSVELPPFGHETLQLKYALKKHDDVRGI